MAARTGGRAVCRGVAASAALPARPPDARVRLGACPQSVSLHNVDQVSDRSLYALAANCPQLAELALAGYNENITDGGVTVLLEACKVGGGVPAGAGRCS